MATAQQCINGLFDFFIIRIRVQTAAKNAAQKASKSPTADIDAIQAAYDARNPHMKRKEN